MSEHRVSPPTPEFLDSIHPEDLEELYASALVIEVEETAFSAVMRRHEELLALSDWLIEHGDMQSTKQETREKDTLVEKIAASFFLDSSRQVKALVDDYEDKVFVGEV